MKVVHYYFRTALIGASCRIAVQGVNMAGEQSFKAVVNDTNPKYGGRAFSVEITGSNYNHFLGKKIGDSVDGMFIGEGDQSLTRIPPRNHRRIRSNRKAYAPRS